MHCASHLIKSTNLFLFQIPLEIVDVETTGYVLRLCPFESLAFSGVSLTEDDLEAFIIVSYHKKIKMGHRKGLKWGRGDEVSNSLNIKKFLLGPMID